MGSSASSEKTAQLRLIEPLSAYSHAAHGSYGRPRLVKVVACLPSVRLLALG